jgi:serine protease Do
MPGKTLRRLALCLAVLLPATMLVASQPRAQLLRDLNPFSRTHRLAKLLPAVVNFTIIKLLQENSDDPATPGTPGARRVERFGSGFIIDPSGIIVTNRHVIDGAAEITVTLSDGRQLKGTVIAATTRIDCALVKINGDKPFPVVKWGDSSKLRVGDQVMAVGNPLGVGESVSYGIVSGLNRNINISAFDDFIQTDASINPGNSGGALVNMSGEVVGVNTALFAAGGAGGSVGIGFALPEADVRFVVDNMRRNGGKLKVGYLGAVFQDVSPAMADALGLAQPRGQIIATVGNDTPAAKAGLQQGDVVQKFGEQMPKDIRALARMIAEAKIDAPLPVTIWRDGKSMTIPVTPTEWIDEVSVPVAAAPAESRSGSTDPAALGLKLTSVPADARAQYKLAEGEGGVLVQDINAGSIAAERGLVAGDVILRVQGNAVATPEDVAKSLADARTQNRHFALLLLQRPTGQRWETVPIAPAS